MGSMSLDYEPGSRMDVADGGRSNNYMQKFRLYETRSNFYMIGRDKHRTFWKVLKINRLEQSELSIIEDSTTYSEIECYDLLKRIHEGNKSTGGLKFVTTCYGIVGFIKFLGPYYMLLITKRKKIGTICGHEVYSVAKSEMIPVLSPTVDLNMAYSKSENRYKKLLRAVDLTKDFFYSYSYNVMISLQKNMSNHETGLKIYENMFVWNEFLTNGIRNQLKNSIWTVALVHGFFRQVKLSVSGRDFDLILIARRSRHYAGTRYLKRGVNEKGRVANDVETEQIVIGDALEGRPLQISSVVQNRGSIPLFWSQETSRLNVKPDIILSKTDHNYEATRLHFENLVQRYGNPIIILNLIKTREKKPRESILRTEFANAIELINKDLSHENRLKFLHWDLSKYSRNSAASVLAYLVKVASNAVDLSGFFYFQVPPLRDNGNCTDEDSYSMAKENHEIVPSKDNENQIDADKSYLVKYPKMQKGVLRTNCIDCLDRTNVAQYVYGLVALGHQLHALGYIGVPSISLDSPLADDLMKIYESMGDILALQYGGSAAHNKIFSERRGQWKAATQSQEFLRTLQRYYSNAYMDAEKQDAINVFLGHFQPQKDKPALWELGSDQHYNTHRLSPASVEETARLMIKRSLSDGNILCGSDSAIDEANVIDSSHTLPANAEGCNVGLSELTSEISTCESEPSFSRHAPFSCSDSFNCSNFLDFDWVSSSGNSCEEEIYERSLLVGSSSAGSMSLNEIKMESSSSYESGSSSKGKELASEDLSHSVAASSSTNLTGYSKQFANWVVNGDMLFP